MKNTQPDRYGAAEKCRAVLAVWMESKKASTLCRELEVSASLFSQWQDRALSGMLEALEPRGRGEGVEGPALPVTIRRLLDRKVRAQELLNLSRTTHYRRRPEKLPTPSAVPATAANS